MKIKPMEVLLATGVLALVLLVAVYFVWKKDRSRKSDLFAAAQAADPSAQGTPAGPPSTDRPYQSGAALAREQAKGGDKSLRLNAIKNLALLPPDYLSTGLLENLALTDPDPDIRAASFSSLGQMGVARDGIFLPALAKGGRDAEGARTGLSAQGKKTDISPSLLTAVRQNPEAALAALSIADGLRGSITDVRRVYREAMQSQYPQVSQAAIGRVNSLPEEERRYFQADLDNLANYGPPEVRQMLAPAGVAPPAGEAVSAPGAAPMP